MDEKNFIESALAAGAAVRDPIAGVDHPCVLVPPGYTVQSLESYQDQPNRKRAKVSFNDAVSFARYITEHRESNTTLFARLDENGALFTAILDYHSAARSSGPDSAHYSAGWKDHQATYSTQETVEWKRWRAKNKQPFEQKDFAEFIEENLLDIVTPAGAANPHLAIKDACEQLVSLIAEKTGLDPFLGAAS